MNSTIIISYFGGSNNFFAEFILNFSKLAIVKVNRRICLCNFDSLIYIIHTFICIWNGCILSVPRIDRILQKQNTNSIILSLHTYFLLFLKKAWLALVPNAENRFSTKLIWNLLLGPILVKIYWNTKCTTIGYFLPFFYSILKKNREEAKKNAKPFYSGYNKFCHDSVFF